MASIVERLTENIVERNLLREGAALSKKWEKTGLLEGIDNSMTKTTMSRLLENQAKELLREASTMSAGDVEGFAAVAFPIVRRVFGGLIANELVAVQPMSLPSGLIFFLDFNYSTDPSGNRLGFRSDQSVYAGGVLASQITGGVDLNQAVSYGDSTPVGTTAEASFYALNNGYSSPTGSTINKTLTAYTNAVTEFGTLTGDVNGSKTKATLKTAGSLAISLIKDDPDIPETDYIRVVTLNVSDLPTDWDSKNLTAINLKLSTTTADSAFGVDGRFCGAGGELPTLARRLTRLSTDGTKVVFVLHGSVALVGQGGVNKALTNVVSAIKDNFDPGIALGSVKGADIWGMENATNAAVPPNKDYIPEIDIKVDSIAVTAQTKKLKAKWSPELGQDLNAYHNLDAEVELTSILSEHVALEIDQEILNDLVKGATAAVKYWSRRPGQFVNRDTGASVTALGLPPEFTGNVSMWYETLIETINDVSAQIHRKTLRGGANFLVTSPEVANLLEFTSGFRADISMEDLKGGSVGAVKAGSISKKWDVYVDPYFPRNLILVGRRGKAFLESGYVYAPYVPLMITPTIFGTEDFVPRKGLMTRYAKKMVRPDMFGLVVVKDLIG